MKQIYEKYYLPYKREKETENELVSRIDKKIIEDRFNYLLTRDIFIGEVLDVSSGVDRNKNNQW